MTTIVWTVTQLDRNTSNGFVTTAHWRATATDGDYSASIFSTASWSDGSPAVPYANLTEQQVLGWIWQSIDKASAEQVLEQQIALQKNPVTQHGTPWSD